MRIKVKIGNAKGPDAVEQAALVYDAATEFGKILNLKWRFTEVFGLKINIKMNHFMKNEQGTCRRRFIWFGPYDIKLSPSSKNEQLLETLAHEFAHVSQMHSSRLKQVVVFGHHPFAHYIRWDGQVFGFSESSEELPWEQDATEKAGYMLERYIQGDSELGA